MYLRGRSPIVINSNYYGIEALLRHPTRVQVARAATLTHVLIQHKRNIQREDVKPILVNGTVPLCSKQYERTFNTVRSELCLFVANCINILLKQLGSFTKRAASLETV